MRGPAGTGARPGRRAAAFALAAHVALAGCLTHAPGIRMTPGVVTALAPGSRASLPGGARIAYLRLRADSRCPDKVVCIHAGWADIDVAVDADGLRHARVLSTRDGADVVFAAGWQVELVGLGPGPSPLAHVRASAATR